MEETGRIELPRPDRGITGFKPDKHASLAGLRVGADSRNRAGSLLGGSQALCQLSYVRAWSALEDSNLRLQVKSLLHSRYAKGGKCGLEGRI